MRLFALGASVLPALYGSVLAYSMYGQFNFLYCLLTIVGIGCIHTGANLINDYFDHLTGADEKNTEALFPFSGGSGVIQNKIITPLSILRAALLFFAAGSAIGIYLAIQCGFPILILGIIGIVSSLLYVAPKISLINLGIGEIFIGLDFGILAVLGAFYVQTGFFSFAVAMAAVPLALIIALILIINEFPDWKGDAASGKKTLVVRLGRKKASRAVVVLLVLTVISIIVNAVARFTTPFTLLALLCIPLLWHSGHTALKRYDTPILMIGANKGIIASHLLINLYLILSCFFSKPTFIGALCATALVGFGEIVILVKISGIPHQGT